MDEDKASKISAIKIFTWVVKLSGLALAILFLVMQFGEGIPNLSGITGQNYF